MVTLDTNVAVYAFSDVVPKAAIALDVLARSSFVSVQLLNEFTYVLHRKRGLAWPLVRSLLGSLRDAVDVVLPIDEATHCEGIRIAERYKLAVYDSVMLAAALAGGARTFYSEDMQDGMMIDSTLRVVNPFGSEALA